MVLFLNSKKMCMYGFIDSLFYYCFGMQMIFSPFRSYDYVGFSYMQKGHWGFAIPSF